MIPLTDDPSDDPFHSEELALHHALHAAQQEFRRYLNDEAGMDAAYFSLELRGRLYFDIGGDIKREVVVRPEEQFYDQDEEDEEQ